MIHVFVTNFDDIKKACIDAKIDFEISQYEKITLENLKICLHEGKKAINILSTRKANLNTCDLTFSKLVKNLRNQNNDMCSKFANLVLKRYKERRNDRYANELAFLLANEVSQAENMFYDEEKINWAHFEQDLEYFVPNFNSIAEQETSESQDALTDSMNIDLDEPTASEEHGKIITGDTTNIY